MYLLLQKENPPTIPKDPMTSQEEAYAVKKNTVIPFLTYCDYKVTYIYTLSQ